MIPLSPSFAVAVLCLVVSTCHALNVVIAGGTGKFGKVLASKLASHDVTILTRNAFLASAPARVTEAFGWVGLSYLQKHPHVSLRDWDGGDLLDIVGKDWVGWQDDVLRNADCVVNLVGGFTQQRNMATERLVRESLRVCPSALQITVSPREEDLAIVSPGMVTMKKKRLQECEDMVKNNCANAACLRLECNMFDQNCDEITSVIESQASG